MTVEARLDIDAVRRRFSALDSPLAFFDGPGGTQVPDEVIDAIARYLRESNANVGGPYGTSRATEALITQARLRRRLPRLHAGGDDLRREHDDAQLRADADGGARAVAAATRCS